MWSKSNADKLKMELSGKREKQLQQSIKNEKKTEDDSVNVKMDSGFLSDANLSCDMLSKENIEYNDINCDDSPKETTKTTLDSGLDIGEPDCLSELDVDQNDICKPLSKIEHDWKFYFQQNDDGDTYVYKYIKLFINHFDNIKLHKYFFIHWT